MKCRNYCLKDTQVIEICGLDSNDIENSSQELGLGPGFFSVSPFKVIRIEQTQSV